MVHYNSILFKDEHSDYLRISFAIFAIFYKNLGLNNRLIFDTSF